MEKKIKLVEGLSWQQKKNAIEASLIMGFYSTSSKFPITSREEGMEIPNNLDELQEMFESISEVWPKDYVSAIKGAQPLLELDWRKSKGLENMFSKGTFLGDKNFDGLPDNLNFKIMISKASDISILAAACNFAFRYGMETTAIEGSIIAEEDWKGNLLKFEKDKECGIEILERDKIGLIRVYGQGEAIEKFSSIICESFPLLAEGRTWIDQLQDMTDSFAMKNLDGQLSYLKACEKDLEGKITAYINPKIEEIIDRVQLEFPNVEFKNHKSLKQVYEKTYDIPWEVDVFKNILNERVYKKLQAGDEVKIYAALSEDKYVREDLTDEIKKQLEKSEVKPKNIEIISAYKQGFSWIEEIVLPQVKGKEIKKMEIAFKPFLPEGEENWLDEDGSTPSYDNINSDNPDKWFDIPIRYLQELYPIDDIISSKLEIDKEMIGFVAYKGEEDITYKVDVFGQDDQIILGSTYKAAYSERPYLDDYPQMGKVHPSTGYIKVVVNGVKVVEEKIATDLENIWDIYQKQVLPECKRFIETSTKGDISLESQPFFSQLRLEINASEPDYNLPFREDIISSLNSFHQDIYFVGLDYFKNYGMEKNGISLDAPGLILPVINKSVGKPKFKVTLYDQLEKKPLIKSNNKTIESKLKREDIELYIEKISYKDGRMGAVLNTDIKEDKLVKSYIDLLNKKLLKTREGFRGIDSLEIKTRSNSYRASIVEVQDIQKDLSILDIDLKESTLIGYDEYIEIINKLKRVDGIAVYPIATSYLGRDIYAIELLPKDEGYVSRTKRITNLPSEIINCRHHANEVSSTNAAFILLKKLLTEEKYENISEKLNLIIVPVENVDGTVVHYELQKDNPNWKLHVSRFNAVGKEFYNEYFNTDTIHTEALGFTKLWDRWLPDIIVDNHGVPSHEWDQQFSGYTSPSYKGFWLPRSLLYGYFWMVSNEEYKSNYIVNKKVEEVIAERIAENDEITGWNKEWMSIFEKYAHSWMPKLFPAKYFNNMINYWISYEFDPEHRYPSIRFPWITTVAYTSEVADETAQGDYLNLCARTHVAHDEAVIEMLMKSTSFFESRCEIGEDHISLKNIRHRPLVVNGDMNK